MKKKTLILAFCIFGMSFLFAEASTTFVPLAVFKTEQSKDFKMFQYGGALMVNHLNGESENSTDGFSLTAMYNQDLYTKNVLWNESKLFHSIALMGEYKIAKNDFMVLGTVANEAPFSSLAGTSAGIIYGRQILDSEKFSLLLGGGLFLTKVKIGDFTSYVVPLPLVRFGYNSSYVSLNLEFLGSPNFGFTLFPESRVRLTGNIAVTGFSSIRDLSGDVALRFYLFPDSEFLSMMNVMVGAQNAFSSYGLKNGTVYGNQCFGIFAGFDMSLITIKGGFNFGGTQTIEDEKVSDIGKGFYLSIQGGWMF